MKRAGLALALGASIPFAAAADGLSVSGEFNVQLNALRLADATGARVLVPRVDSAATNLRFKGTESLGGGLTASFYVSSGFRIDTGNGGLCNRECFVGLAGDWGVVKLGRLLPVYDDVSLPWYYIQVQGNHNPIVLWSNCGNGAGTAQGCQDSFVTALRYDSPAIGGVSFSASVADLQREAAPDAGRAFALTAGAQARGAAGYVGLALQQQHNTRYASARDDALTLAFEWKGPVTVGAGYERLAYSVAGGGQVRRDYGGVMLSKAWGPVTVWANAGRAGNGYGSAAEGAAVNNVKRQAHTAANMYSLGVVRSLSRWTRVYAFYNTILNEANARYSFDTATAARLGTGQRIASLVMGISKKF